MKKMYLSYGQRIMIHLLLIPFLALLGSLPIYFGIQKTKSFYLNYNDHNQLNYRVFLKSNDYYDENYLEMNKSYLSSLIDYIDTDFYYNFKMNDSADVKYTYSIDAKVIVYQKDQKDKVIFEKNESILKNQTIGKTDVDNFSIKENIKLNYEKYNNIAKSFKTTYNLSADSELQILFRVNTKGSYDNEPIKFSESKTQLTIPLTEQTITIDTNSKNQENSDVLKVSAGYTLSNLVYLISGSIILIVDLIILITFLIFLKKSKRKKTPYQRLLGKILKEFDRVIVASKQVPKLDPERERIDVLQFEELLDVSDRIEKPILFAEIHKNQKALFLIQDKHYDYIYILKAADLKEDSDEDKPAERKVSMEQKEEYYQQIFGEDSSKKTTRRKRKTDDKD